MRRIDKPKPDEYPEYSEIYMSLLEDDGRILDHFKQQLMDLKNLVYNLPEEKLLYRYAPGKWTIKEILVHNIDDERIFSYRALRYARNDDTPISGFDQESYARHSGANERSLESIFEEYEAVRNATIMLFKNLPEESLMRSGAGIDENGQIVNKRTVRALVYHLAGHERRHMNIIKERYL